MNLSEKIAAIENFFNANFNINLEDTNEVLATDLGYIVRLSNDAEMSNGTFESYENFDADVINDIFDIIENQMVENDKTWERSQDENW